MYGNTKLFNVLTEVKGYGYLCGNSTFLLKECHCKFVCSTLAEISLVFHVKDLNIY